MPEQLGEIFRLQGGFAFKSADFQAIGVPVIKIADVTGGGALDFSSMQCVSDAIANQAAKFQPGPRDALIAMTGANVGRTTRFGQSDPVARINQRVGRFVPVESKGYSKDYAYYLVSSSASYKYFKNAAYGSAQPNISGSLIERLPIPNFQKGYANQIGDTLASFDNMIELNRRMNETLEAMAQALFKDWFVDFGPTRAKIEGRDPYLAPEIWDLFPDKLDEDGKPEGWETQSVINQAEWVNGAAYRNMHFSNAHDALPVVKIAELKAGVTESTKRTNTELGDKYRIRDRELLFSWSGNPDTSIDTFIWTGGEAWLNQHIFAVRNNGARTPAFLYTMLKWLKPEFAEIARNKQTTGLGHVTKQDLKRMQIHVGPHELLEESEHLFGSLHARLQANLVENMTLAQARDLLLPNLMSGEVRVGDADKIVQEFT